MKPLGLLVLFALICYVRAAVIVVAQSGGQYTSINAAIRAAAAQDEIEIRIGDYSEIVIIPSALPDGITIRGASADSWKVTILRGGVRFNITAPARPRGLTVKWLSLYGNSAIKSNPLPTSWIMCPTVQNPTSGVEDFTMDQVYVYGNLGGPGQREQMGVALNGFSGTLTVRNCEFNNVGWGIFDTGSGSTYSSAGIYTTIVFDNNNVHDCYGGVNFRCNSGAYCQTLTISNNRWEDISNSFADNQWPLKGFEAFHVTSLVVKSNTFRRIDRGAIGHGGSQKGMALETFNLDNFEATDNVIEDTAQGFSIRCPTGNLGCTGPTLAITGNTFSQVTFYMLNVSTQAIRNNQIDVSRNAWDPDQSGSGPQPGDLIIQNPLLQNLIAGATFPWLTGSTLGDGLAKNCSSDCGAGECDFVLGVCYCPNRATNPPECSSLTPTVANAAPDQSLINGQDLGLNDGFGIALIVVLSLIIVVAIAAIFFLAVRYGKLKGRMAAGSVNYGSKQ